MTKSLKRKMKLEEDRTDEYYTFKTSEDSEDDDIFNAVVGHAVSAVLSELNSKPRKERGKSKFCHSEFWEQGFIHWNDKDFKHRMRASRQVFNYILKEIGEYKEKTPTNLNPGPTHARVQLALTLYRLGQGRTYPVATDIFGFSEPLVCQVFNHVCRILVARLHNKNVYIPSSDEEWQAKLRGFIENYEFSCVGAWDGFHIYTTTKLKQYYSFKKRYFVSNMEKRFLYTAVGAPGSTHDSRLLRNTRLCQQLSEGEIFLNKCLHLGHSGEIPLVTIGGSTFPQHSWLLKAHKEDTKVDKERYFNKKLCSARVVTENCYGMLKERWRILYKNTKCKLYNLRYVIMSWTLLHNICIRFGDSCEPKWR